MGKILKALEKSKSQKQYKDSEQKIKVSHHHLSENLDAAQNLNVQNITVGRREKEIKKAQAPEKNKQSYLTKNDSIKKGFSQPVAHHLHYNLQAEQQIEKNVNDEYHTKVALEIAEDNVKHKVDKAEITRKLLELRKEYSKESFKKLPQKMKSVINKRKNDLITIDNPNSIISEQFKISRSLVSNAIKENNLRTILVTSSLPLEGKSYVSSNLAVSIARGLDEYVLLVDTDLNNPSLHKIFRIQSEVGLTDFLVNVKYDLSDIIKKTQIPKLSMLPAGIRYERSSELLASELMSLLIQELKYRYTDRYIIFDSSPIIISQSLAIADKVDAVLIVVKSGKTNRKLVSNQSYSNKYIRKYL